MSRLIADYPPILLVIPIIGFLVRLVHVGIMIGPVLFHKSEIGKTSTIIEVDTEDGNAKCLIGGKCKWYQLPDTNCDLEVGKNYKLIKRNDNFSLELITASPILPVVEPILRVA